MYNYVLQLDCRYFFYALFFSPDADAVCSNKIDLCAAANS